MFSQSFIDNLPHDNEKAAVLMCECFHEKEKSNRNLIVSQDLYDHYVRAMTTFKAFCDPYALDYDYPLLSGNPNRDVPLVREFFAELEKKLGLG